MEKAESFLFTFPFPLYLCLISFLFSEIFLFLWYFSFLLFFWVGFVGVSWKLHTIPICSFPISSFLPEQRGNPWQSEGSHSSGSGHIRNRTCRAFPSSSCCAASSPGPLWTVSSPGLRRVTVSSPHFQETASSPHFHKTASSLYCVSAWVLSVRNGTCYTSSRYSPGHFCTRPAAVTGPAAGESLGVTGPAAAGEAAAWTGPVAGEAAGKTGPAAAGEAAAAFPGSASCPASSCAGPSPKAGRRSRRGYRDIYFVFGTYSWG